MHSPPVSPKKSPGPSEAMITSPSFANGLDEVEPRAVDPPEGGVFTRPEPEAAASCSSREMAIKVTQWPSRSLSGHQGHSVGGHCTCSSRGVFLSRFARSSAPAPGTTTSQRPRVMT